MNFRELTKEEAGQVGGGVGAGDFAVAAVSYFFGKAADAAFAFIGSAYSGGGGVTADNVDAMGNMSGGGGGASRSTYRASVREM